MTRKPPCDPPPDNWLEEELLDLLDPQDLDPQNREGEVESEEHDRVPVVHLRPRRSGPFNPVLGALFGVAGGPHHPEKLPRSGGRR